MQATGTWRAGGSHDEPSLDGGEGTSPSPVTPLLVVTVAGYRCAIPLDDVIEVLPAARVEPLPGAPDAVLGILDLRSELTVVLDGHRCLGVDGPSLRPSDRFVVLRLGAERRALRVDAAHDVYTVPTDQLTTATSVAADLSTSAGIVRLPDGLVIVHDTRRFLSPADTAALGRLLAEHGRTETR